MHALARTLEMYVAYKEERKKHFAPKKLMVKAFKKMSYILINPDMG